MARTGLYKSEVKKARDALLAQNKHPSVDAVRIELGNTGSKTTIHKYLRELDEDDGGAGGRKVAVSEAIQDLVARLAAQMQDEAQAEIDTIRSKSADQERQLGETIARLQDDLHSLEGQLQHMQAARLEEATVHAQTREALHAETVARHKAEQQAAGLNDRLAENEAHRVSLEEKHQHAREALEHYRQSVKEQRDQDVRRHEQQVQQLQAEMRQLQQSLVVKQEDVTRLNQEGARLVADLSHAQKALHDEKSRVHQLEQRLEQLLASEQRSKVLERELAGKEVSANDLKVQLEQATQRAAASDQKAHALELALSAAQAKLEAEQSFGAQLRAYMAADQVDGKGVGSKASTAAGVEG